MCCRKIEMDDTRQQRFGYPEGGLPVPRICNALNDFSNGTVECHWHPEFQFGLVLKGELEYLLYRNPTAKVQRSLKAGDGFFINSRVLHSYSQLRNGAEIFIFPLPRVFSHLPLNLETFIRKPCFLFFILRSLVFSLTIIRNDIRRSLNFFIHFITSTRRVQTMNFTDLN